MPNPLCHFELQSNDPERSKAFYGSIFDWRFDDESMPGYSLIQPGAEPFGGMMTRPRESPAACLHVYFQVRNVDETLIKVEESGGQVIVPAQDIPGVGRFGMVSDPDGIVIGLLQTG